MTLGIMQPYFFPYLGYYGLIHCAEEFIFFDAVQYIRKGWMSRNRVLKNGGGLKYIGLTMDSHSRDTLIKEITISNLEEQKEKVIRNLDFYKATAPYYNDVIDLINDCFDSNENRLSHLYLEQFSKTLKYLGIHRELHVYSDMGLIHSAAENPGDWALHISEAYGAKTYINPPGGKAIFDPQAFSEKGIELRFLEQHLPEYSQASDSPFEPGLSIIDVMMFNSPQEVHTMIEGYSLT